MGNDVTCQFPRGACQQTGMSSALKQALQFVKDDLQLEDGAGPSSGGKKKRSKDAMKHIGTQRKGVWKQLRRLQQQEGEKRRRETEHPNFKSTIDPGRGKEICKKENFSKIF